MELNVDCTNLEVRPNSRYTTTVILNCVEKRDVLNHFDTNDILEHFEHSEILDLIDLEFIKQYLNLK